MNPSEITLLLLSDQFMASFLLPPHTPYIADVMRIFGGYAPSMMIAAIVVGSLLAVIANYSLGRAFSTMRSRLPQHSTLDTIQNIIQPYAFILLLPTAFLSLLAPVLITIAGFFKIRIAYLLLSTALSYIGYAFYVVMIG